MISHFTLVALLIAFFGNFSLLSFILKIREKELAIRKLLGADILSLAMTISKSIVYQSVLMIAFTLPIGWWLLQKWLSHYVYRIELDFWYFLLALVVLAFSFALNILLKMKKIKDYNPAEILGGE